MIQIPRKLISKLRSFFQRTNNHNNSLIEEPLRSDLYSSDQMERFGKSLATAHKLSSDRTKDHLLKRLTDNERLLTDVRKLLANSIKNKDQITPAGEWLIDNFYLIEDNIRDAKKHFPKGYSETLPQLSNANTSGVTRVYDIVFQLISHSDGRIDIECMSAFLKAYQTVNNLHLGELWAIPIMLRLALIENLRRVSARIVIDLVDGNLADKWAKQMIESAASNPKNLILVIADMVRSQPPMTSAFVSELTRQLRGNGLDLALSLNWIEQQLSENGLTSNELVNSEIQKQAADQVSISNSINSLRMLSSMDWREFVEEHSIVEQTLRKDINGVYGLMDFSTRDRYRHAVERIAKKSKLSEYEVACLAIKLSKNNPADTNEDNRMSHVGYYLIDKGLSQTQKNAKMSISGIKSITQILKRNSFALYISFIVLFTLIISAGITYKVYNETNDIWLSVIIGVLSLIAVSHPVISIIDFISSLIVKPELLPRMDFSKKIPPECRTLVIVPAMLTGAEDIENLVEALEVRYLANRNDNLHFGLLTDFIDAPTETTPEDQLLIDLAKVRIEELNKKYDRSKIDLFYLFHRPRLWNPKENVWMGYERKRGKLSDLNSLLRGNSNDRFSYIVGDKSIFPEIKYIITLDADTQLPLGSAWKLIGAMSHPLNRAWYDEKNKRVTKGYGVIQPRVAVSLPETNSSFYSRMNGNEPGIDPYTKASSDIYQDLFDEGSFIGKGIYEVDIFKKVLEDRFVENGILSHDLLEGCYIRSGLISDVQLFEKYPISYRADIKRRSRWTRGDWQILFWILPFVPAAFGKWSKNPISALSRWKIFDNLRRGLVPAALTIFLILGWTALTSSLYWTIIISSIIVLPVIVTSTWNSLRKPKDVSFIHHIKTSARSISDIFVKSLFKIISLPFEAFSNLSAIGITQWRIFISRKKLLEWNTSANTELSKSTSLFAYYTFMWIEPFIATVLLIFLSVYFPDNLLIASPILFLWLISPLINWRFSKPFERNITSLTNEQYSFLRKVTRKTYSFFEHFVDEENNWLPPDNYQEQPIEHIANRTSPTNIGLTLLSDLNAFEFGYITMNRLIERSSLMMSSLTKLERYKGHFYNWYDTKTLAPLFPKYISTVDSGNLVGHLIILKQGLLTLPNKKLLTSNLFKGIRDTFEVLLETLHESEFELINDFKINLKSALESGSSIPHEVLHHIELLSNNFNDTFEFLNQNVSTETYRWKIKLRAQLYEVQEFLQIFTPWNLLLTSPSKFAELSKMNLNSTLHEILNSAKDLQSEVEEYKALDNTPEENEWLELFQSKLINSIHSSIEQIKTTGILAEEFEKLCEVEWDFLFDSTNNLFSIGYNVQEHRFDTSNYDLLASEARFATYIGIAQNKLPEKSWFALGRLLTSVGGDSVLLSWSGSMFEYLMPLLVMPTYENTLLDQTCRSAVEWQIKYGKQTGKPWGISESGFNMINAFSHYQYRAFGAPGLGLKRGLEEDLVIAPYASMLSLMVSPEKACENLQLLSEKGFEGRYGFYEAIDYTPSRLQRGQSHAIVYSFMAHHKGMSMLALAYLLLDKPMQKLFESEPQFKSILLLLQERIPRTTSSFTHTSDISDKEYSETGAETRIFQSTDTSIPEVHLLSNGRYNVMISNSGAGYSRWKDIAITRWREDVTRDNHGVFCYISDLETGEFWSNTHQPALNEADKYEAAFSLGRVDFHSIKNKIESHTIIVVSPEDDVEIRRVMLTNNSNVRRIIEITSYAEVVLSPVSSDLISPAFNNLFVQTEILRLQRAILCTRRPRSNDEQPPWLFHLMSIHDKKSEEISFETDRMEFIGRGNTGVNPQSVVNSGLLSGSQSSVLDPIVSIRHKIILEPEECVTIDMVIGVTETKESCENLINKYQDKHHMERSFELAWTHSQVVLRQLNASEADAQLFGRLASSIIFPNSLHRADPSILINNQKQQSGLWGYSISGDLPIVLVQIEKQENMVLAKQLIKAHGYWRLKGLAVDLVIWNEEHNGYRNEFQNEIEALIPTELKDKPGGIFVRAGDQISTEDKILFQSVARISISDRNGTLAEQLKRKAIIKSDIPFLTPVNIYTQDVAQIPLRQDLIFFNGKGGFSQDGTEYIININEKSRTPAPWINVIANPNFGTVISESGSAYTWIDNAHELRLTPWNNDPVSDSGGEVFYLRDEESGNYWSTSLIPAGGRTPYITRHGFGYSIFEHVEDGIHSEMIVFVDKDSTVKFTVLKIRNQSGRSRKLSATGYVEWVLGDNRTKTSMHIQTLIDPKSSAIFAKNPYNTEFSGRVGFFDVDFKNRSFTTDRTEFIGRNGTLQKPDAMSRVKLSGKVGLAIDPCAAIQVQFDLADGEDLEIIFRLGAGNNSEEASSIAKQFKGGAVAFESFEKVKNYWKEILGTIQIETPDVAINIIANGWLTYQTLSCRIWGRSGFYQSSGAFGFRDQLQDVASLFHISPQIARNQIILHASRQFKEGDVQHWWHPPSGRGVRTRISDDFLWLPLITALYIFKTGDTGILDEQISYIEGRQLNPDEESYYDLPIHSNDIASLYEHCVQAIKHGLNFGERGLPLIGTGDWNDGLDKVGEHGKGESVWMAFFLYDILIQFAKIAEMNNDDNFAEECILQSSILKKNIDKHAWDGNWYKRAWFDDGTPLGSSENMECQIDSISQSWSVLSGAGESEQVNTAMQSAYERLVNSEIGIVKLLDPPFDKSDLNPGYIKGYVPGVRENGGQYTHAAIWLVMAFAKLGNNERVWELLKMINPVNHGNSPETLSTYKVEPYVMAADVYASPQHTGRGGWTWYTGSAGWMYRLISESLLGLKKLGNKLIIHPCIPHEWESFKVHYNFYNSIYHIEVIKKDFRETIVIVDDVTQVDKMITLIDDGGEHYVEVSIPR